MSRGNALEANAAAAAPQASACSAQLFTFDCRRADGSPICLEAHELGSDESALALARKLLAEHLTCSRIEVFQDDRRVGAVARDED